MSERFFWFLVFTIRRAGERGRTLSSWLDSHHTFSFGKFRDPDFTRYGPLCALNEDRIAVGGGFRPHSHKNIEIVTYPLDGTLRHRESTGSESVSGPGQIQRMSAGSGITHSAVNAGARSVCRVIQLWFEPSTRVEPSCELKPLDAEAMRNRFSRLASPSPRSNEIRIAQDAEVWAARIDSDHEVVQRIARGRKAWLHVARGEIVLNETILHDGDGAALGDDERFLVRANVPSELLLIDLA